jgi:hypothetical protein
MRESGGTPAFKGCLALRSIDLSALSPEAEIVDSVFAWSRLVEVEFPAKLQSLGFSRLRLAPVSPSAAGTRQHREGAVRRLPFAAAVGAR